MLDKPLHYSRTVMIAPQEVLPPNPGRAYALIANMSDTVMYIGLGFVPTATDCIPLGTPYGSYEINATNLFRGRIYAMAGADTKVMTITEA